MTESQQWRFRFLLSTLCLINLCSCHRQNQPESQKRSPGLICSAQDVQGSAIDLIFEKAEGAVSSQIPGPFGDAVLTMVKKISSEHIFQFDSVTFDHFDEKTGVVGCEAFLSYHLPPADLTAAMKAAARKVQNSGLSVPIGLLEGRAQPTPYHFEIRDVLGGQGGKLVESGEDLIEPASALIRIASVRVVAEKMQTGGQDSPQ